LHRSIKKIRDALEDSAVEPRFIETEARTGYRFIAPLLFVADCSTESPAVTARTDTDLKSNVPPGLEKDVRPERTNLRGESHTFPASQPSRSSRLIKSLVLVAAVVGLA